jgi:hypothetical protein
MKLADLLYPSFSAVLAGAAVYAAVQGALPGLSLCAVALADLNLLTFLGMISLMWSKPWLPRMLPSRFSGVLTVGAILVVFIFGYANLYVASRGIVHQAFKLVEGNGDRTVEQGRFEIVQEPKDAIYFSVVTMSTLGYGDFVPANDAARRIVVWQMGSALLLVIVVFPLLVSRLALHRNSADG